MSTHQVSIAMSEELLAAIDKETWRLDLSRSAANRTVLADHLREIGQMRSTDPTTTSQGLFNPHFRPRRGRS